MRLPRLTLAGIAVGGLLVAACSDASTSDESERDESGEVVEEGDVGALVLQVGDCFDDPGSDAVSSVPAVPCDEPHVNEVYALFDVEGDDWPGEESLRGDAEAGCIERFDAYVGTPYAESALFSRAIIPSEDTWEQADDREIICIVYDPSGERTGSAEGSNL